MEDRMKLPLLGPKTAILAAAIPAYAAACLVGLPYVSDVVEARGVAGTTFLAWSESLALLLFAVVVLVALVRRLADWGLPWLGYFFGFFIVFVPDAIGEDLDYGGPVPIGTVVFAVVVGLAYAVAVVVAARRGWRRAALLSFGIGGVVHLFMLGFLVGPSSGEHLPVLLAIPVALVDALLVWLYVRGTDALRTVALAAFVLITLGTTILFRTVTDPALEGGPVLSSFFYLLAWMAAAPLLAILGPAAWQGTRRLSGAMRSHRAPGITVGPATLL
jgi:hypothetical protein